MAEVKLQMQAIGVEAEKCDGCGKQFERGQQMTAVEYDDGEPAGWFCDNCIANWKNQESG